MPISRRSSLALIGGGVVVAATAPAVAFLATRTPDTALAPWDKAGGYADARMRALSYALLAPNPHNRQPWQAELVGRDGVTLYRDPKRALPVTDPLSRQLTIGMGCFLELMGMAAAQEGLGVTTTLFPSGEAGPTAVCRFTPGAGKPDPLFAHVLTRRTHKGPFEARAVPTNAAKRLSAHAQIYTTAAELADIRRLAHNGWIKEVRTAEAWQESVDLLRIGKAEINANPDGIPLSGAMIEAMAMFGMLTRTAAADLDSASSKPFIERTANAILQAPAITVSLSERNTRADQIAAGRQWLKLNLAATAEGLALRPVSQSLQEYPAMKPIYDEIHARLAPRGETVQMLGIMGYGLAGPRTPRWPLESRMLNA
ncbi:MAG: twin-arginine translocation pathway signal protein [Hyphomicrobiaceae bacterium]|nr:twin-arginine translocation pathway signal protein [Hyphomicrobiaceae bacterium]